MTGRTARGILCIIAAWSAGVAAQPDDTWKRSVAHTISTTCAMRGLDLKAPLGVMPMDEHEGGYTPGIGNVTWETDDARNWREGWCALGVYCAPAPEDQGGTDSVIDSGHSFGSALGLYDQFRNLLFVRDLESGNAASTIAHETVHALQYQNFPALRAIHLWSNRDLAAAVNSAIEGDAHVVGSSFNQERRTTLCSMDPARTAANSAKWWRWQPDELTALQAFPHAFGSDMALREMVAHGPTAMDRLLREPPMSTLAVLKPELADADIDFIRLPEDFALEGCTPALRNTAGVVGIWGLLRQLGDAEAGGEELPAFLEAWRGDRFVHLSCPGDHDDELAWMTRWRTPEAAATFANRYRAVASALPAHGGVLGSVPEPTVYGQTVIVVTAGLRDAVSRIADSEVRALSRYGDWVDAGCFPDQTCYESDSEFERASNEFHCAPVEDPPRQLRDWLDRIRQARAVPEPAASAPSAILDELGTLDAFCAVNGGRNLDILTACRAISVGIRYVAQLDEYPDFKLLPYCLSEREFQQWVRSTYHANEARPHMEEKGFAGIYAVARASAAFAAAGFPGLHDLTAAPPLSTLALLRPGTDDIDLIGLPLDDIRDRGCEVTASDARGTLAIWRLLMDYGLLPEDDSLPAFLGDWKGDRLFHVRCQDDAQGDWAWISRWRTTHAASTFATHYRELTADALAEAELPVAVPVVEERTVWIIPAELRHLEPALKHGIEVREFQDFDGWVASGCFPQQSCN